MPPVNANRTLPAASPDLAGVPPSPPRREGARIHVELTDREARSLIRATTLVADLLRPELFRHERASESPLVTAYQVLLAACERYGVDLGLGAEITGEG